MAKKEISTQIQIKSTPEKVWQILINFQNYSQWNPFITELRGDLALSKKLQVTIQPVGGKIMRFSPVIKNIQTNKKLSWLGTFLFKGLFDGLHQFEIIDNGDDTIQFIQKENFSGILVSLFNLDKTKLGFDAMNQALKRKSEE